MITRTPVGSGQGSITNAPLRSKPQRTHPWSCWIPDLQEWGSVESQISKTSPWEAVEPGPPRTSLASVILKNARQLCGPGLPRTRRGGKRPSRTVTGRAAPSPASRPCITSRRRRRRPRRPPRRRPPRRNRPPLPVQIQLPVRRRQRSCSARVSRRRLYDNSRLTAINNDHCQAASHSSRIDAAHC